MDALTRLNQIADRWTPRIVVTVIAAAFILSYAALLSLAIEAGYHPLLAWLWPLVLDGVVIASSLSLLKRQARGDNTFYSWFLLVTFDATSIWLNASYGGDWLFATVHGLPPLTLVLLLKLWTADIKTDARHTAAAQTLRQMTAEIDTRQAELAALVEKTRLEALKLDSLKDDTRAARKTRQAAKRGQIVTDTVTDGGVSPVTGTSIDVANDARQDQIETRRAVVLDLLSKGLDKPAIAAELDVSPRTIARDIKSLNGAALEVTR